MERSGHLGQDVNWSHTETPALLAVWSEDRAQRELELGDSASVTDAPETFSTSSNCSMENLQEPAFYPVKLEDPASPCALTSLTSPSAQTSVMWSPSPGRRKARPTCSWSKKEVLTLLALWANPAVQQELRRNVRNNAVYNNLSAKLATLGFNKTAQKCKEKLKKLKQDYKRIKNSDHLDGRKNLWFNVIDQVLGSQPAEIATPSLAEPPQPVGQDVKIETPSFATSLFETCSVRSPSPCSTEVSKEPDIYIVKLEDRDTPTTSSAEQTSDMCSPRHEGEKRYGHTCNWSKKEVHLLLAFWANPAVQEELCRNVRNNAVYHSLSAKLASFGFTKSPQKCKEKIKKLKQDYRKIRSQNTSWRRTAWFGILDEVLGSQPAASKCPEAPKLFSAEATLSMLDLESNVSTDAAEWQPDEVQVLITLWAQPNIQKQLLASGAHRDVFTYLSNELALIGFNKTPQQCSVQVKTLKEKYEQIKRVEPRGNDQSNWFAVMDGVLGPGGETSKDVTSAVTASPEDSSGTVWTSDEVGVLLSLWAEESVQERLESRREDERVYAQLSSELATQGFDKTTGQCRTKIRLLEQEYGRIKEEKAQRSSWFAIMDKIHEPKTKAQRTAEVTAEGRRLSVPSLCLLVPTLRLMCAFAWQVVQCCNVAHYNKVEELVVLATELAPELLTARERAQLLLRLRARLVLELCRSESRGNLLEVQPHLTTIQDLVMTSGCAREEVEELEKSKSNFVEVVHTLLDDPEERKRFFTEVFPIHYGQPYEATLQSLVWKFISRLDNLLPVPDIKQTAAWLSSAPSVMEECGQLVLEREELKALLYFHEQQTGNANKCLSQAQNMFLPVLSLPAKTNSRQQHVENKGGFNCGNDKEPLKKSISVNGHDLKDNPTEGLKPFQLHCCSMCSYSDSQASALLQHIRQEHLVQESGPFLAAEGDFLLNDEVSFRESEFSGDTLKDVVAPVNKGPPFQCDRCEKTYLSRSSLIIHHRIHTGETPFLCSFCGRGFRRSSYLELHTRIHTGERRFRCHICGKTSIQHLTRHMRMHRGEKNYLCTECGKAFLSSGELKLHLRSHSGERPYTCGQCGKGFVTKCLLTVHARRHTGESPYRCPLCPKSFPSVRAQKKHLKIHTDTKSYQCLKCGKIFRQEGTLKLHVKTHDSI